MKRDLLNNKDFLSGVMFALTGGIGWWMALDYPFGSTLRMGPGYFPSVLSGIMFASGIYFMLLGLRSAEMVKGNWSIRALVVLPLATAIFGFLMEEAGFIPAMIGLVIVSAASGREFKWGEVIALTIGLTVLCAVGFVYLLGLPYPMIKGLWEY